MNEDKPQRLYVECRTCGEVWCLAVLPVSGDDLCAMMGRHLRCPNCREAKAIDMSPEATAPKEGRRTP